jgi:hypothetical protein
MEAQPRYPGSKRREREREREREQTESSINNASSDWPSVIPLPASSKITADDRKKISKRSCLETLKTLNRLDIEDLEADAPV